MKLMRLRHPEYGLESLRNQINRMFEDTFEDLTLLDKPLLTKEGIYHPSIELKEEDNNYILKVELPGMEKDNINVEITNEEVIINAESEYKHEEKSENIYKSEFKYGKFMRTVPMPSEIKSDETKAEFKNGILTITAPKSEEEHKKCKKINID